MTRIWAFRSRSESEFYIKVYREIVEIYVMGSLNKIKPDEQETIDKLSVLVVDDEVALAAALKRLLIRSNFDVVGIASNALSAIEMAGSLQPDIVLMDISLPGKMNGIQAMREIMTRYNIPSVILTGYDADHVIEEAKSAKPYGYLLKPFNPKEIRATIEIAMSRFRLDQADQLRRKWLEAILESIDDAVIVTDNKQIINYFNPAAEELTGFSSYDVTGKNLNDVFVVLAEQNQKNPISTELYGMPFGRGEMVHQSGEKIHVEFRVVPVKGHGKDLLGYATVFRKQNTSDNAINAQSQFMHDTPAFSDPELMAMLLSARNKPNPES